MRLQSKELLKDAQFFLVQTPFDISIDKHQSSPKTSARRCFDVFLTLFECYGRQMDVKATFLFLLEPLQCECTTLLVIS